MMNAHVQQVLEIIPDTVEDVLAEMLFVDGVPEPDATDPLDAPIVIEIDMTSPVSARLQLAVPEAEALRWADDTGFAATEEGATELVSEVLNSLAGKAASDLASNEPVAVGVPRVVTADDWQPDPEGSPVFFVTEAGRIVVVVLPTPNLPRGDADPATASP